MQYLIFALRNLTQRRIRTGLTIISIAVAVAVLFTLLSFNKGYDKALKSQLQQMGVHAMVLPIGCPYEAASLVLKGGKVDNYLPESVVSEYVDQIDGIQIAAPAFMSGIIRPEEGRTDIYFGVDERTFELKNWWKIIKKPGAGLDGWEKLLDDPKNLMSREDFVKTLEDENSVILGYDTALIELSTVGDELYVPEVDRTFKIAGVLAPTGTQDDGFFYVPLRVTQDMFKKPGKITVVQIRFKDLTTAILHTDKLDKIPGTEVVTMSELMGTMQSLMGSARTLIISIIFVAIAISALGVLNTVLMSVFERTREIGMMKAVGASRADVFKLIWTETILMCAAGGLAGIGFAVAASNVVEAFIKGVLANAAMVQVPKGTLIGFSWSVFWISLALSLILGLVAGAYPAWRAASVRPIEAIRTE